MTKALMVGVFGARGTGKNAWTMQELRRLKPARLIVWDHKHDPTMADLGEGFTDLGAFIRALGSQDRAGRGRFALRYMPDHAADVDAQFDLFCRAAFMTGCLCMVVDELPEVTKANRAPPAWRQCVNVGRLYRGADGRERWLAIYGLGQRPSECDKSFMNNLDVLHSGRVSQASDARVLADLLAVDYRKLMALPDLHWMERRQGVPEAVAGVLQFAKKVQRPEKGPKAPRLRNAIS